MILVPPIPQDFKFHNFADQREILNIPHFWNVITNIPFIFIGFLGLFQISKKYFSGIMENLINAYRMFFIGLILIGLGSGYYHLDPSNIHLVWDRIPITISFMAFFTISLGESVSIKIASKILYPLLFAGILSVIYWYYTENIGEGDLRLYGVVQLLPILIIPLLLIIYGSFLSGKRWIITIIMCYGFAKITEIYDCEIYEWVGFSGHSIKHLAAAYGAYLFLISLEYRRPLK